MAVTLREIAKATGLSVPTVGNVLSTAGHRHSAKTREVVLDAARRMGYRPNASARAIRSGRFGCLALILSRQKTRTHSYLPIGLLDGIEAELGQHDMHLTVTRVDDSLLAEDGVLPKVLRQSTADGLIVHYTHELPETIQAALKNNQVPIIGTNAKLDAGSIYPDDYSATKELTARLYEMGHRRIALIQYLHTPLPGETLSLRLKNAHYSVADRRRGYIDAMVERGLVPEFAPPEGLIAHEQFVDAANRLMNRPDRPTAVIAYSERELLPLIHVCRSAGLSIPKDVSVTFFGSDDQILLGLPLSAIQIPLERMGREAVRCVVQAIESPGPSIPSIALRYQIRDRMDSVAVAKK
jgi:DNA-binding LacI/PurR family transcriptional regulator